MVNKSHETVGCSFCAQKFSEREEHGKATMRMALFHTTLQCYESASYDAGSREHLKVQGHRTWSSDKEHRMLQVCVSASARISVFRIILCVYTSAVKRLKYLIAINRIYVIVNSRLIAINRKFLSILNVPSFIFFHNFSYQHGKVDWLALCKCFILLKNNIAKQGGTK